MPIDLDLAHFEGRWHLDRAIVQSDGTTGRFTGTACFEPLGAGALTYREAGTITLGSGPALQAARSYIWEEGLHVLFADGRPFHQIPASGETATHICPPDTYEVAYNFTRWPCWTTAWQVSGPRKSYRMVSTYRPAL